MSIPFLRCMIAAAAFYHLPPRVLPSIQAVEGGSPGLVSKNGNGSADLGVMQVNTVWLTPLARITGMTQTAVANRLTDDACFNIAAAAAIMRSALTETGGDLMAAVARYHSHTPALGMAYQQKVLAKARAMFTPGTKN
jgi:hypothetical protein